MLFVAKDRMSPDAIKKLTFAPTALELSLAMTALFVLMDWMSISKSLA